MISEDKIYKEPCGTEWNYKIYKIETKQDKNDFKILFIKQKKELENKNISTSEWARRKVKLFGFYKSYPHFFNVCVGNNFDHPFQFYKIEWR